ncbi:biotin-dependent carboxyltransferase family protein [Aquimarina litoralis]|uniref:5-oxoprolinase subunit C family protein n=1 Tax=Aquimarina litoralis TaxID=584605 RepID=UPI001C59C6F7|nr:biotin-dependent carboxyltransferase family protein [Aquimarina litoralis]MBW1297374.1 allophanate hydrolase subunit 2 family protein [Aquimarina litoralis]
MVEIISSGMYTTIQDEGRFGFSKYGVPQSGAMDKRSYKLANALLDNDPDCAVIEWMLIPPVLKFYEDSIIAITGVQCDPFVDDKKVKCNHQLIIKKGSVLKFKNIIKRVFGYVGIKNGFCKNDVLNSRSQYKNVTDSESLSKGSFISYNKFVDFWTQYSSLKIDDSWWDKGELDVFPGPEYDQLSNNEKELLKTGSFTISTESSRMAISLNEELENDLDSMISVPVLPGTVQLTPSGRLIVLMRDCQTTGGYPRILQLSEEAINIISQKRTNEEVRFSMRSF